MMATMFIAGTAVLMWVLFGYSLSFGGDNSGFIGNFDFLGLSGVSISESTRGLEIPDLLFCAFQMMFAIITPALITGAVAGRMKFKALVPFICLWSLLVYYPLAHMVWGGGFMEQKLKVVQVYWEQDYTLILLTLPVVMLYISAQVLPVLYLLLFLAKKRLPQKQLSATQHSICSFRCSIPMVWLVWI